MTNTISTIGITNTITENDFSDDEFLIASLTESVNTSLRQYSEHKKWNVQEINIDIDVARDEDGKIISITRKITFIGNLDDEQKNRLLTIANCCPIQKTLSSSVVINSIVA